MPSVGERVADDVEACGRRRSSTSTRLPSASTRHAAPRRARRRARPRRRRSRRRRRGRRRAARRASRWRRPGRRRGSPPRRRPARPPRAGATTAARRCRTRCRSGGSARASGRAAPGRGRRWARRAAPAAGSWAIAWASFTRWRCPVDIVPIGRKRSSPRPTSHSASLARLVASRRGRPWSSAMWRTRSWARTSGGSVWCSGE